MFEKMKLKSELKTQIALIEELEQKRVRSQAELVEAILKNEAPSDSDVEYFNKFSEQIDVVRRKITELQNEIDKK